MLTSTVITLAALALAGCGMANEEDGSFESAARRVANIPLTSDAGPQARIQPVGYGPQADEPRIDGLRTAMPLRIEVLDPHDLWDARDGLVPVVRSVVAQKTAADEGASDSAETYDALQMTDAMQAEPAPSRLSMESVVRTRSIQLGAYSSEAAANRAWDMMRSGKAAEAMTGLSPVLESVTVNGRALTRLKVMAPDRSAKAICEAANIRDAWCARPS